MNKLRKTFPSTNQDVNNEKDEKEEEKEQIAAIKMFNKEKKNKETKRREWNKPLLPEINLDK